MSTLEFILIVFLFTENVALLLVNHFDRQALERDGFGEAAEAAMRPRRDHLAEALHTGRRRIP